MPAPAKDARQRKPGVFTRDRGKFMVVSAATILCLYLCYRLAEPFLPALVWAITGAVVTHSYARWLERWIVRPNLRAGVAVATVAVVLFAPAISLIYFAALQVGSALQDWHPGDYLARWQAAIGSNRGLGDVWQRISENFDVSTTLGQIAEQIRQWSMAMVTGSMYTLFQALIALFILFFLYRDEEHVLASVRQLSPLSENETNRLLKRLGDTIHATVFGIVIVAIIQGTLGGLIFWLLGLPTPALWGTIMALLAMVPYLGTFVIWAPAALLMAVNGEWGRAIALAAWGTCVIAVIDNLIYPMLVGTRLRQHTVITFLAIVGGVALFGGSGLVLGPVVVSLTFFLLEVWRRRTTAGRPAECA